MTERRKVQVVRSSIDHAVIDRLLALGPARMREHIALAVAERRVYDKDIDPTRHTEAYELALDAVCSASVGGQTNEDQ